MSLKIKFEFEDNSDNEVEKIEIIIKRKGVSDSKVSVIPEPHSNTVDLIPVKDMIPPTPQVTFNEQVKEDKDNSINKTEVSKGVDDDLTKKW